MRGGEDNHMKVSLESASYRNHHTIQGMLSLQNTDKALQAESGWIPWQWATTRYMGELMRTGKTNDNS